MTQRHRGVTSVYSARSPKLAMLAHHSYLSLFLVPILEKIWVGQEGGDSALDLDIHSLGPWPEHEKCGSCMAKYAELYVDRWSPLSGVPYDPFDTKLSGGG